MEAAERPQRKEKERKASSRSASKTSSRSASKKAIKRSKKRVDRFVPVSSEERALVKSTDAPEVLSGSSISNRDVLATGAWLVAHSATVPVETAVRLVKAMISKFNWVRAALAPHRFGVDSKTQEGMERIGIDLSAHDQSNELGIFRGLLADISTSPLGDPLLDYITKGLVTALTSLIDSDVASADLQKTVGIPGVTFKGTKLQFANRNHLRISLQNLLKFAEEGVKFAGDEHTMVHEVFKRHPRYKEKAGRGVRYYTVGQNSDAHTESARAFLAVRKDGSSVDFSYLKCLQFIPDTTLGIVDEVCDTLMRLTEVNPRCVGSVRHSLRSGVPFVGPSSNIDTHSCYHKALLWFARASSTLRPCVMQIVVQNLVKIDMMAVDKHRDRTVDMRSFQDWVEKQKPLWLKKIKAGKLTIERMNAILADQGRLKAAFLKTLSHHDKNPYRSLLTELFRQLHVFCTKTISELEQQDAPPGLAREALRVLSDDSGASSTSLTTETEVEATSVPGLVRRTMADIFYFELLHVFLNSVVGDTSTRHVPFLLLYMAGQKFEWMTETFNRLFGLLLNSTSDSTLCVQASRYLCSLVVSAKYVNDVYIRNSAYYFLDSAEQFNRTCSEDPKIRDMVDNGDLSTIYRTNHFFTLHLEVVSAVALILYARIDQMTSTPVKQNSRSHSSVRNAATVTAERLAAVLVAPTRVADHLNSVLLTRLWSLLAKIEDVPAFVTLSSVLKPYVRPADMDKGIASETCFRRLPFFKCPFKEIGSFFKSVHVFVDHFEAHRGETIPDEWVLVRPASKQELTPDESTSSLARPGQTSEAPSAGVASGEAAQTSLEDLGEKSVKDLTEESVKDLVTPQPSESLKNSPSVPPAVNSPNRELSLSKSSSPFSEAPSPASTHYPSPVVSSTDEGTAEPPHSDAQKPVSDIYAHDTDDSLEAELALSRPAVYDEKGPPLKRRKLDVCRADVVTFAPLDDDDSDFRKQVVLRLDGADATLARLLSQNADLEIAISRLSAALSSVVDEAAASREWRKATAWAQSAEVLGVKEDLREGLHKVSGEVAELGTATQSLATRSCEAHRELMSLVDSGTQMSRLTFKVKDNTKTADQEGAKVDHHHKKKKEKRVDIGGTEALSSFLFTAEDIANAFDSILGNDPQGDGESIESEQQLRVAVGSRLPSRAPSLESDFVLPVSPHDLLAEDPDLDNFTTSPASRQSPFKRTKSTESFLESLLESTTL